MKSFRFSLESALQWRKAQQAQEEEKLKRSLAEHQMLEAELRALEASKRSATCTQLGSSTLPGSDFRAMAAYLLGLQGEISQCRGSLARAKEKLEKQQSICLEAQRRVELLQSLKAKRYSSWKHEAELQLELIAAESYLSRRARERN